MPKLRNAKTDIGMFTQWLGRKCRNHNPLGELLLNKSERASTPRMYNAKAKGDLAILAEDEGVLLYTVGDGRVFEVTVREVSDIAHAGKERVKVEF